MEKKINLINQKFIPYIENIIYLGSNYKKTIVNMNQLKIKNKPITRKYKNKALQLLKII